jgi:transcriptional regulator with XRE-family HTH domain
MLNYKEITKRIKNLIQTNELTASGFAEKIGVQRSSISHIISGRNKPSLEFLIKITEVFPETSLSELVYGDKTNIHPPTSTDTNTNFLNDSKMDNSQLEMELVNPQTQKKEKSLIMIYSDGTFEKYNLKS